MTSRQAAVDLKLQRVMQSYAAPFCLVARGLKESCRGVRKKQVPDFQDPGQLRSWERHDRIFHVILKMFQDWWLVIHDLPIFIGDEKGWMNIHWPSTTIFLGTCRSNFGDSPDLAQQCANESIRNSFFWSVWCLSDTNGKQNLSKMYFMFFYVEHLPTILHQGPQWFSFFVFVFASDFPLETLDGDILQELPLYIIYLYMLFHVHECSWYMCLRTYKNWFTCEILCTFTMRQWVIWINMCIIYIYIHIYIYTHSCLYVIISKQCQWLSSGRLWSA